MADAPAIPRVHFNIALRIPRHAGVTAGQLLSSLPLGWLRRSVMEPTQQRAYSCWASRTILGTLGDYIGKYRLDFRAVFDFALKGDHLEAQLIGPPTIPIFASAKDKFIYRAVDAQLDSERDTNGKVVAVILLQNERCMRAPRTTTQDRGAQ